MPDQKGSRVTTASHESREHDLAIEDEKFSRELSGCKHLNGDFHVGFAANGFEYFE